MKFTLLALERLRPSPTNPRKHFDESRIAELAQSLRVEGMIEPIICVARDDHFEIVCGECRYRAAEKAGFTEVPCVIREMTDAAIISTQMAENIARSSLNPMEEADGIAAMVELGGMDEEGIAKSLGTTRKWVQSRLSLTDLPPRAKQAVRIEAMSITVAQEVLALEPSEMEEATELLLEFGDDLTGAQARLQLQERYRAPRERREAWAKRWEELRENYEDVADPIDDCEQWATYLRPYGEAYGRYVEGDQRIGAAAAKEEDAGIAWRDLAKALGIKGLVVPLTGNGNIFLIFDRSKIEAAEKSARESGEPFTLGPRKKSKVDPTPPPASQPVDPPALDPEPVEDGQEDQDGSDPAGATTDDDGNPHLVEIVERIGAMGTVDLIEAMVDLLREAPGELLSLMAKLGLEDECQALIDLKAEEVEK